MGYSGRYHAASLVAVFIALAVGIVIGVGLADDVVSGASEELERSLRSDLEDAEGRADSAETELDRERQFTSRSYPALVDGRLDGTSVALVGIGGLPDGTNASVEAALEPTGASIDAVAVIGLPQDPEALASDAGPRFEGAARGGEALTRLGRAAGAGIVGGSPLVENTKGSLFSRFNGDLDGVDRVVLVPAILDDLSSRDQASTDSLIGGFYEGVRDAAAGVVAVESTEVEPSGLEGASSAGISTVDHVDLTAGQLAMVFSLLGASGDFGVKEGADSFLPELIRPTSGS